MILDTIQQQAQTLFESSNTSVLLFTAVSTLLLTYTLSIVLPGFRLKRKLAHFPIINKAKGEFSNKNAVERCSKNAGGILKEGYEKYDGPFQIIGSFGTRLVLPPAMADWVKTDPRFNAVDVVKQSMASDLPGFEGLRAPHALTNLIRTNLSTNLSKFTEDLIEETEVAFDRVWGRSTEWHEVDLMPTLGQIIAQIGTRIFLGPELCRNPAWQENAKGYTINVFMAVRAIRRWPLWSRPYVHWFLKDCQKARGHVRRAREILAPVIAARKETIAQAQKKGCEADLPSDVITWTYLSQAKEDKKGVTEVYHPADFQLSLNMASVHTTSDLFSNVLFQLARHPEWIEPLHREAKEALGDGKWEKQSLYHMKLADSMLKETQRMKPLGILLSHRYALEDVTLPDNTLIPKGTMIATNMSRMWDPEYYSNPNEWQPDRYLKQRQEAGKENSAQFVTTTLESLGFGIGTHACPGRFFASTNLKIMLAYVLENYEFERVDDGPDATPYFVEYVTNASARMRVRRKTA